MNSDLIIKFNEKCAKFIGAYLRNDEINKIRFSYWTLDGVDDFPFHSEDFQFHNDWNWIKDVIDKIWEISQKFDLTYGSDMNEIYHDFNNLKIHKVYIHSDIDTVIDAVDEFIDWYENYKNKFK